MRCVFIIMYIMGDDAWFGGQQTDGALWHSTTEQYWCRCHDRGWHPSVYVALMSIGHLVFCVIVAWEWHMFGSCHHLLLIPNFLPRLRLCGRREISADAHCWSGQGRPREMFTFAWHTKKLLMFWILLWYTLLNISDQIVSIIVFIYCQVWFLTSARHWSLVSVTLTCSHHRHDDTWQWWVQERYIRSHVSLPDTSRVQPMTSSKNLFKLFEQKKVWSCQIWCEGTEDWNIESKSNSE